MDSKQKHEIDLFELMVRLFIFFKRHFLLVTIVTFLGLLLGIAKFYLSKDYYKTKFLINSGVIEKEIIYEMADNIQVNIDEKNTKFLSSQLGISEDIIKEIKSFEVDTSLTSSFKITLEVYNTEIIDSLKFGIINYINSNDYVSSLITKNKVLLENEIAKINEEIAELDSIQKQILNYSKKLSEPAFVDISSEETSSHIDVIELYKEKVELEKELLSSSSVSIILDSNKPLKPEKEIFLKLLIFGGIFFLLSIFIALFLDVRKKVKERIS